MIIDTSAAISILLNEAGHEGLLASIAADAHPWMSAVSYLEAAIVIQAKKPVYGINQLDSFIKQADIKIIPFDEVQARGAAMGYLNFGKGRHPAALNFGDCATYGAAFTLNEPVLFVGNDFSQTGLQPA